MSKQISLMDSIDEVEREEALAGRTIVATPIGTKRHVLHAEVRGMTVCGRMIGKYSIINPADENIDLCKECLGSLRTQLNLRRKMG